MTVERVEGTLERVDPFYLPIFQYKNAINDEQCEALRSFCEQQPWQPSIPENIEKSSSISLDTNVLLNLPDMKEHFELLMQDISFQVLKQNTEAFRIGSSWCTKTEKGQMTPMHRHKNYYMAGVLYLQDDNNLLISSPYWNNSNYVFSVYQQGPYTCNNSLISSPKNSFLLMPAWMDHQIPVYDKDEVRYSIAMNFIPIGEYGVHTSVINVK